MNTETSLAKKLENAVKNNDLITIKELLILNGRSMYGVLCECASNGNYDVLKMILKEFKPDVNQPNWYWRTPVGRAMEYGQFDCFSILLEYGGLPKRDHRFLDFLYADEHYDKYIEYLSEKKPGLKCLLFKCIINTLQIDMEYNDNIKIAANVDDDPNKLSFLSIDDNMNFDSSDNDKLQLVINVDCTIDNFGELFDIASETIDNTLTIKANNNGSLQVVGSATFNCW